MADAAAMANPLSLPVAVAGTVVYALATPAATQPGQVGYVSLAAAAALLGGSVPTIALTKRVLVGQIPDRVHAVAYLILLGIILIAMGNDARVTERCSGAGREQTAAHQG